MFLRFDCVQCGKEWSHAIELRDADPHMTLRQMIEAEGWIVQMNYPFLDVYCSKQCAR